MEKLKVDHVDLLHLHSTGDKDIDKVLSKDGSWEFPAQGEERRPDPASWACPATAAPRGSCV
jgi:hypothetical protein